MNRLRTGILGCGSYAQQHARVVLGLGDQLELVAFCDRHADRAGVLAHQFTDGAAAIYSDTRELVERADLDLLIVTLPPYSHHGEVELAARHGVNLLIEKPIALTREQAWRMVAAVEETGVRTQVGFKFRFGAAVEQLKDLIEAGEAGPVGLFSARYFANSLHAPWWRVREKSGGQLVEQAIHLLDLGRFLVGEARTVYSRQENIFHQALPDYTIEDVSATVITFKNRALGVIYATNGAIPNRWINDYRLVAQNVTADFMDTNHATFYFTADPSRSVVTVEEDRDLLAHQMLDLIEAIRTGQETRTPVREGALSLDLALKAVESAQTHREVSVA